MNLRQSPREVKHSLDMPEDWMEIESRHCGYLLDIEGANGNSGSKVIVWPKNNGDNQKWKFKKGFIKSKLNKKLVLSFNVIKIINMCIDF